MKWGTCVISGDEGEDVLEVGTEIDHTNFERLACFFYFDAVREDIFISSVLFSSLLRPNFTTQGRTALFWNKLDSSPS